MLSIKKYFYGTSDQIFSFESEMEGIIIKNDGVTELIFIINGNEVSVGPRKTFNGSVFEPFTQVSIIASSSFRGYVMGQIKFGTENRTPMEIMNKGTVVLNQEPLKVSITPSGSFPETKRILISSNKPSSIYYTTNGSVPTNESLLYTGPIDLLGTTEIKAFAIDRLGNESSIEAATYTKINIPPFVVDGLQIYYDFTKNYTITPSTIEDDSGNENTGTLSGFTGTTDDGFYQGELFHKDYPGSIISIAHNPLTKIYPFTIEFYSRFYDPEGQYTPKSYTIFDSQNGGSGYGLRIFANTSTHATDPNTFHFGGTLATPSFKMNLNVYDNMYRHIVIVWEQTVQKIYINGVLMSTNQQNSINPLGTHPIILFGGNNSINGSSKLFRFYNKALTDAEVLQNHTNIINVIKYK